jgi:hypothetical protein
VLGHRHGHVVGHDVGDRAEAALVQRGGQPTQRLLAAEAGGDPVVVDHVVAVHGPGGGLQDRR